MTLAAFLAQLRTRNIRLRADGDTLAINAPPGAVTPDIRAELSRRKPEILAFLRSAVATAATDTIPRVTSSEPVLSFAQERLWFLGQLVPDSPLYNMSSFWRLEGELADGALERSLAAIQERHTNLRTVFPARDGRPVPVVVEAPFQLTRHDLSEIPEAARDNEVQRLVRDEAQRPFDLASGPLFRATLIRVSPSSHLLLVSLHHIVSDGWSMSVLQRELERNYAAFRAGIPPDLSGLPVQYADFAAWQRQRLSGAALQAEVEHWKTELSGVPAVLDLAGDHGRPAVQSFRGARQFIVLPKAVRDALHEMARQEGATLFMVLLAAYSILLSRRSGQDELIIGTPAASRSRTELEGLIGLFLNTLPVKVDLRGNPTFRELIRRVKESSVRAFAHQDLPFEKLVDELHLERDMSYTPLIQAVLAVQSVPAPPLALEGLRCEASGGERGTAKFDITLHVIDREAEFRLSLEYSTDLFEAATARQILEQTETILRSAVAHPNRRLDGVDWLTPESKTALMQLARGEVIEAFSGTVVDAFRRAASTSPESPAMVHGSRSLSYRQLEAQSNQLARHLVALGLIRGGIAGIVTDRSIESVIGMLAVLKTGAAYLPLDPAYSTERVRFALTDAGAQLVLSGDTLAAGLDAAGFRTVVLDRDGAVWAGLDASPLAVKPGGNDLAYVIYTSGSTGIPKGVEVEHRALVNLVTWHNQAFTITPADRATQVASLGFDASVWEIWPYLSAGAAVHLIEGDTLLSAARLKEWIVSAGITIAFLPTPVAESVLDGEWPAVSSFRALLVGGDELRRRPAALPFALINNYGPTENAVVTTSGPVATGGARGPITIGRPVANNNVHVLDRNLDLVPVGVPGELCVGGASLARGYRHRPDLTAAGFVPDPFSRVPGARLYRTGDLVRYRADGEIEFLGRIDSQVKIRGFRIEPGEVESVLRSHGSVGEAVVIVRADTTGVRRLIGYVVPSGRIAPASTELRSFLKTRLPDYMVPSAFVVLDALPLTPNGKIDRQALPLPARLDSESTFVEPGTPVEKTLAGIWSTFLKVDRVGIHDNFFDLGGDSILSIQIIAKANQAGLRLSPKDLFQYQTIAELAAIAEVASVAIADQGRVEGEAPLTPVQRWFFEQNFENGSHWNQSTLLETHGVTGEQLTQAVRAVFDHHDAMRLRFRSRSEGWMAVHDPDAPVPFEVIAIADIPDDGIAHAVHTHANRIHAGLKLETGPLIRFVWFDAGPGRSGRLLIVAHHLIVDGVSWRVLGDDLESALRQIVVGAAPALPPKTTSFKSWSTHLMAAAASGQFDGDAQYWLSRSPFAATWTHGRDLTGNTEGTARTVSIELTFEETQALLQDAPRAYHTQINDLLMAALVRTLCADGAAGLSVHMEGHGREELFTDLDISRTFGWFTSLFPVTLELPSGGLSDDAALIRSVKEQLRALPRRGIGYGLARYGSGDVSIRSALAAQPSPSISFNYLGQFDSAFAGDSVLRPSPEPRGHGRSPGARRPHALDVTGSVRGGRFRAGFVYSTALHEPDAVEALAGRFRSNLLNLVRHCSLPGIGGFTPSDFPLTRISQQSLDALAATDRRIEDLYPLSPAQQGMLFHTLYSPVSGVYVVQLRQTVEGALDVPSWRRAWDQVTDRHPVLRTDFAWENLDEPAQVVRVSARLDWHVEDLRALPPEAQSSTISRFLEKDRRRGFDLAHAPLMRMALFRTGEDRHEFVWTHHHLLMDGWTLPLVRREVLALYRAFAAGQELSLERRRPYRDYIAWLQSRDLAAAERYWRQALSGFDTPTPPGVDRPDTSSSGEPGYATTRLSVSAATTRALDDLARQNRITLNTVVLGAWGLLLQRYSGTRDVVFGATVSGRPPDLPGVESMIGPFINTVPVRVTTPEPAQARIWLRGLQEQLLAMRDYEFTPLSQIQNWSEVQRGLPLFETIFVFENYPAEPAATDSPLRFRTSGAFERMNYPLGLVASARQEMSLRLMYETPRFDGAVAGRILGHLRNILEGIARNVEAPVDRIPLLSDDERDAIVSGFNATARTYPRGMRMHEMFEAQADRTPRAEAVVDGGTRWTYADLDARANQVARRLRQSGIGPEVLVGICISRSAKMIAAILGVLKTGGAYVAMDPAYPVDRIAYTLNDARMKALITESGVSSALPAHDAAVVLIDDDNAFSGDATRVPSDGSDRNLAYVIYTSGSTGKPKGVAIEHASAVTLLHWAHEVYTREELAAVLASTSICFDLSVYEMFVPLTCGGKIVVVENALGLIGLGAGREVTLINTVPSAMAELIRQDAVPAGVKVVNLAGEPLPTRLVDAIYATGTVQKVFDLYGPSEDTTYSTFTLREADAPPTIGRPLANSQVYILDSVMNPVPVGVAGELYMGGDGLSRGYLHRPDLTAERYIPDPFSNRPGARLYRTGDLGRYRDDGNIEFLGRIDHQVKIRGFRIELGEIEAVLGRHPQVEDVVVVAREDETGQKRLVAYVATKDGQAIPVADLRAHLKEKLPDYMVPAVFVMLEALPRTPNGKVDRKGLPAPDASTPAADSYIAPRNETEEVLATLWAEVLKVPRVGIHDNFFELGGDSIQSIQIVARSGRLGLKLGVRQLFEYPTVAALASVVRTATVADADQAPVSGPVALTPVQHWFFERHTVDPHHWNNASLFQTTRAFDISTLERAVAAVVDHHDALRTRFRCEQGVWSAEIAPAGQAPAIVEVHDLSQETGEARTRAIESAAAAAQASLALSDGPLIRMKLFRCGSDEPDRLLIVIHHLIIDGISWRIVLEDLELAYDQIASRSSVELPHRTTPFKHWAEQLTAWANSPACQNEATYWTSQPTAVPLPRDFDGANTVASSRRVAVALVEERTKMLLGDVPEVYRTQINDLLLTALAAALVQWTGGDRVGIDFEGHGREDILEGVDISRTVGWFTTMYPVGIRLDSADPSARIKSVKEQLRAVPNRGIGYGALRYLAADAAVREHLAASGGAEVLFNYMGQFDMSRADATRSLRAASEPAGPTRSPRGRRDHLIEINAAVSGGQLRLTWTYSGNVHAEETISRLAGTFIDELNTLIDHCLLPEAGGATPSDFPLAALDQATLHRVLGAARNVEDAYPLSPAQQGMVFHSLFDPGSGVYFQQFRQTIEGTFDLDAYRRSWEQLCRRHAILRTSFVWDGLDEPLQIVHRSLPLPWTTMDWSHESPAEQERQFRAFLDADRMVGFRLDQAPLMRLTAIRLGPDRFHFVWSHHHALMDGWSLALLRQELMAIYDAQTGMRDARLDARRPFRDYIAWLRRQDPGEAEAFWRKSLDGITSPTPIAIDGLPVRDPRPYAISRVRLSEGETAGLLNLARQRHWTLNAVVQAAWALVLSRYCGERDVVFGAAVSGRPAGLDGVETMIGPFINTVPVRVTVDPEETVADWLDRVNRDQQDLRQFENVSLTEIQRHSSVPRGVPLFETIFAFENYPSSGPAGGQGGATIRSASEERTHYPISVIAVPGKEFSLRVMYDATRFDSSVIDRMLKHVSLALRGLVAHPDQPVGAIPIMPAEERRHMIADLCGRPSPYPRQQNVVELYEEQVHAAGDRIAVECEGERLSFDTLNRRANRVAHLLQQCGITRGTPVGVSMGRSTDLIAVLVGILKCGACYVPLDPAYPRERLEFMVSDSGVHLVITDSQHADRVPAVKTSLVLDRESVRLNSAADIDPGVPIGAGDVAYIIFTSGSTGRPKATAIPHRAIVRLVRNTNFADLGPSQVFLQLAPVAFDASTLEIWAPLLNGGRLVVAPPENPSLEELGRLIASNGVTTLWLTAGLFHQMVQSNLHGLTGLRQLLAGGDVLPVASVRRVLDELPGIVLINGYGPTENTTFTCCHRMTDSASIGRSVPIGRPVANTTVYVLDERMEPVPIGVAGELFTGGDGVGYGYLNRPELTAERFVPDPFSADAGARLYRTGDRVRVQPDGTIEFIGRADDQIKIRGFRIEPGEIEEVLKANPLVRDAMVIARTDVRGDKQLVAWVVAPGADAQTLRTELRNRVPDYMVPAAVVTLDAFPLTDNGKVDRRALPDPVFVQSTGPGDEPRGAVEEILCGIWCDVLGVTAVGTRDNFFEAGGHSLLATQVISRIRGALGVELPLRTVFDVPTVAGLAETVRARMAGADSIERIPKVAATEHPLLSFAQQRLWFLDQLEPDSAAYNIPLAIRIQDAFDPAAFDRSLTRVVDRHAILRSNIRTVGGAPEQTIRSPQEFHSTCHDLTSLESSARESALRELARGEARRPFRLASDPLIRSAVIRLSEMDHAVLITMHHIVSDGWSMDVFFRELRALYVEETGGTAAVLPELPVQYTDFAAWQRVWLEGGALEQQLGYWKRALHGMSPVLELPTDRPRPASRTFTGDVRTVQLPAELAVRLHELSRREGATLFMTMLAVFQTLLHRYSRQDDIAVGSPIANRDRQEIEGLIGFFVNTLVFRSVFTDGLTFRELLTRVRESALGAYAHQDIPFEKLVDELQPARDMSRTPLFQAMFVMQNAPRTAGRTDGLNWRRMPSDSGTTKFDLIFGLTDTGNGLKGAIEYSTELFDAATVDRMFGNFRVLLESAVANPGCRVDELPILTDAERQQVLIDWPRTTEYPSALCVHEMFEAQAARRPEAVALVFESERWTYAELNARSNQIAHRLIAAGVEPGSLVGLCINRSAAIVTAILGILKAGAAYLPLDPVYPADRIGFMLEDSRVRVNLTEQALLDRLPPDAVNICLDRDQDAISLLSGSNPPLRTTPDQLVYVIYTSGSTGRPKGARITHRNVVRLMNATWDWYRFDEHDAWTLFHSYAFDFSVWEIWGALLYGGRVVVVPYLVSRSPEAFYHLLCDEGITVLNQTPSAFRQLIQAEEAVGQRNDLALRYVIFGGEALELNSLRPWFDRHGDRRPQLVNMYGITETTVHVTYRPINRADIDASSASVIGIPIPDLRVYVVDAHLQPVPVGVPGEMLVGGGGVGLGYLDRPELTSQKFIRDPFSDDPSSRLYRSGDLVRYLPNRDMEYLGRIDLQVKIRGFRIELGEIEAALAEHPAVREVVVIAREDTPGDKRLVAYVAAPGAVPPTVNELRSSLAGRLPQYMVPAAFVFLDTLPLTSNGKIDRKALPVPEVDRAELGEAMVAPRTPVEETLAGIWKEVLRAKEVGVHDNFFALGGDSILSIQIIARAARAGIGLSVKHLFQYQTIAELASVAEVATSSDTEPAPLTGPVPLTPIEHWFFEQDLADAHHWNQSMILRLPVDVNSAALRDAVSLLIEQHDALRLRFDRRDGAWVQWYAESEETVPFEEVDLTAVAEPEIVARQTEHSNQVQASLNLTAGPLARFVLFRRPGTARLLIVIHHLAVDGVSWRILLEDLEIAYREAADGRRATLPRTTSYRRWAETLVAWTESDGLKAEVAYWQGVAANPGTPLPMDKPATPDNIEGSLRSLSRRLTAEETAGLLQDVPQAYHTQINDALLAALAETLCGWSGGSSALVHLEGHGREDIFESVNLTRTVGWFTSIYPVRLDLEGAWGPGPTLQAVKEQLRQVPNRGIGFGVLRYLSADEPVRRDLGAIRADVSFNYLGQFDGAVDEERWVTAAQGESVGRMHSAKARRAHWIDVSSSIRGGQLGVTWMYSADIHFESTIEGLADTFMEALRRLIAHCQSEGAGGFSPSDFPLANLDEQKLSRLSNLLTRKP